MAKQTFSEYFKSLRLLHLALTAGMVIITIILYFFEDSDSTGADHDSWLIYLPPLIGIFMLLVHKWLFRKKLEAAKRETELGHKLSVYRAALILRWALMEGPGLLCIVIAWTTQTPILYVLGLFFTLLLYLYKPIKENAIIDLQLTIDEVRKLQNDDYTFDIAEGGIT